MVCKEATERIGLYLDGELPSADRASLEKHLTTCDACRAELEALGGLAADLTAPLGVPVPETLWPAIESRLDSVSDARSSRAGRTARVVGWRLFRAPWAWAAAVALIFGVGLFGLLPSGSSARASTVDFSVLLNALPLDAQKAFRKFLVLYEAKPASLVEARRYAPKLNFDLPEALPGGFQLQSVYTLRFGKQPGIAATYARDGDFLGTVFHPPVNKEKFGPHQDYPCVVGRHEGHKVSVGQWRLVHVTDPTTCHCILSRLDEQTELPEVLAAVAPRLPASSTSMHHP